MTITFRKNAVAQFLYYFSSSWAMSVCHIIMCYPGSCNKLENKYSALDRKEVGVCERGVCWLQTFNLSWILESLLEISVLTLLLL